MVVPTCGQPVPNQRRIGGKFGLQFDVPTREVKILGGKWDVDYVRYVIKPKDGEGYLELWFGPYAFSPNPEEELLSKSVSTQKRDVVNTDGGQIGADSLGKLQTGEVWRHTLIAISGLEGARYRAKLENASLFDQIVNSACNVPFPKH